MLTQSDLQQIQKIVQETVETIIDIKLEPIKQEVNKIKYLPTSEELYSYA